MTAREKRFERMIQANRVWRLDRSRSSLTFRIRKLFWRSRGRFDDLYGIIEAPDSGDISAIFAAVAASIHTGIGLRDAHPRTSHLLDARRFPFLRFESTSVEYVGQDRYRMTGDLEIKGTRQPVTIEALIEASEEELRIRADGRVDREAFGVAAPVYVEMGGLLLGRDVDFVLVATLAPAPEALTESARRQGVKRARRERLGVESGST